MLRSLIAGYLRSTAQKAALGGLQAGLQQSADEGPPGGDLAPVDLGFVFALGLEARGLVERLEQTSQVRGERVRVTLGTLAGRRIAVIVSGPGQPAARRATAALLAGHRPRCVLSAGLAGGLDPALQHGDLLLVDRVGDAQGRWLSLRLNYEPSGDNPVRAGSLLTVDRVVGRAEEKRSLGRAHGALAVDMETLAVAEACQAAQTPLVAARVICDTADEDLPREVERLLRQRSTAAQAGAALGALARRPQSAADLWRLRNRAEAAAERLGEFLAALVERFPIYVK
ncbi:MAG: hypothetical protein U0836_24705 [Pirellulales bacterium]